MFEKDEALALTFAEKVAKKGLPSAEFAMGYYAEVGVGRPMDIQAASGWYQLVRFHSLPLPLFISNISCQAHKHGNSDATVRLSALSTPSS